VVKLKKDLFGGFTCTCALPERAMVVPKKEARSIVESSYPALIVPSSHGAKSRDTAISSGLMNVGLWIKPLTDMEVDAIGGSRSFIAQDGIALTRGRFGTRLELDAWRKRFIGSKLSTG